VHHAQPTQNVLFGATLFFGATLLFVAALVTGLTKQLAVLLLRHSLSTLLDYGTHKDLNCCSEDDRIHSEPRKNCLGPS